MLSCGSAAPAPDGPRRMPERSAALRSPWPSRATCVSVFPAPIRIWTGQSPAMPSEQAAGCACGAGRRGDAVLAGGGEDERGRACRRRPIRCWRRRRVAWMVAGNASWPAARSASAPTEPFSVERRSPAARWTSLAAWAARSSFTRNGADRRGSRRRSPHHGAHHPYRAGGANRRSTDLSKRRASGHQPVGGDCRWHGVYSRRARRARPRAGCARGGMGRGGDRVCQPAGARRHFAPGSTGLHSQVARTLATDPASRSRSASPS